MALCNLLINLMCKGFMQMLQGIVRWFNDKKGYGFIDSGNKEYFIHFKEITEPGYKTLNQGEHVSFEPAASHRGLLAKSVCRLNKVAESFA